MGPLYVALQRNAGARWSNRDFFQHYFFGGGRLILLREIDLLEDVVRWYERNVINDLKSQIAGQGAATGDGRFRYSFGRSYPLEAVHDSLGSATVKGLFNGFRAASADIVRIEGRILFQFYDRFSDVVDVANVIDAFDVDLPGGRPYDIRDQWEADVDAILRIDPRGGRR